MRHRIYLGLIPPRPSHVIHSIRNVGFQSLSSLHNPCPTSSKKTKKQKTTTLDYLNSVKLKPHAFPLCHNVHKTMPCTSRQQTNPILYTFSPKWMWIEGSQLKVLFERMLSRRIISIPLSLRKKLSSHHRVSPI